MGYFAVLVRPEDKGLAPHLRVERLHVNLWALRGLWFGRRLFHFDVGVELTMDDLSETHTAEGSGEVSAHGGLQVDAIEMLLPFRVEEGKWPDGELVAQDLYESVISDQSGPLIFGSPVKVSESSDGRSIVEFEGSRLRAVRIEETGVKAVDGHAVKADSSLYTVPFRHPVRPGESVYIRLRWRVFGAAPLWRWARPESGARIDFRVCDTRQGVSSERVPAFLCRVLEIASANIFIMAPGRYRPTNVSPSPKHIRTLEADAWAKYLKGAAAWRWMARDLLVYGWHHRDTEKPITQDRPMRVFLALNRPAGRPGWLSIGYAAVGITLVWALLALSGPVADLSLKDLKPTTLVGLIGIGTFLSLWSFAQIVRPLVADRAGVVRQLVRRIERWFLSR